MRIISGEARGRTLFAPKGQETRPTSDKIRGSLFNILNGCVAEAEVMDLFGGTGALALEALSRGAAHAVIADCSRAAIDCIQRNARSVLGAEMENRALILKMDYRSAIASAGGRRFDLVFLDPPYRMLEVYADAISRMDRQGMLQRDAIIVAERKSVSSVVYPDEFEIYDTRLYGETAIDFLRRRQ